MRWGAGRAGGMRWAAGRAGGMRWGVGRAGGSSCRPRFGVAVIIAGVEEGQEESGSGSKTF